MPRSIASKCSGPDAKWSTALADDDVRRSAGVKLIRLDRFDAEVIGRERRIELGGECTDALHRGRILVGGGDVVAASEEVDEVATAAAAGIDDVHAGCDAPAQELVEQVDVDVAELHAQVVHVAQPSVASDDSA